MNNNTTIPICDLHCDTAFEIFAGKKLNQATTQVNLNCLKNAHVGIQLFACYVSSNVPAHSRFNFTIQMIDAFKKEVQNYPGAITICRSPDDIKLALSENKIAAVLTVENGMAIENDLRKLQALYDAGVRCMTITHSQSSNWALSSTDQAPAFDGLTEFGESVIRRMNELGMIIDVSHVHQLAVDKILEISKHPVIASHSCAAALCPSGRNLTDRQIKRIAKNGGMVGINFFPAFLDRSYNQEFTKRSGDIFQRLDDIEIQAGDDPALISEAYVQFHQEIKNLMRSFQVPVDSIIQHIDHIIELVGDSSVGFGSDFEGVPTFPEGIDNCSGFNLIRSKIEERNYSRETVEKIFYQNFMRVFRSVCA